MDYYEPPKVEQVMYVEAEEEGQMENVKRGVRSAYGKVAKSNKQQQS